MPDPVVEHRKFYRRTNPDGTIDSICPACFMTVHQSRYEDVLAQLDAVHECNPETLIDKECLRQEQESHSVSMERR